MQMEIPTVRPNDAPDGSAAVIIYSDRPTTETPGWPTDTGRTRHPEGLPMTVQMANSAGSTRSQRPLTDPGVGHELAAGMVEDYESI